MGLFKKIKDVLFDEEEYTEQIKITPEMRNEETPVKEERIVGPKIDEDEVVVKPKEKEEKPVVKSPSEVSERELFKTDSSFPFFDFDEEEFISQNSHSKAPEKEVKPAQVQRPSNVFEYERKRKVEKRTDFGRFEKTEVQESTERRKFKPSPIISPVYGILDKDYVKTDIIQRKDNDKIDVQTIRDKAFGERVELEKPEEKYKDDYPNSSYYEESETVTISEPEEKEKKVKTIDELLEDTSDVIVDIDRDLDELERKIKPAPEVKEEKSNTEDTLENDLFDLIDSMYDSKEEGE